MKKIVILFILVGCILGISFLVGEKDSPSSSPSADCQTEEPLPQEEPVVPVVPEESTLIPDDTLPIQEEPDQSPETSVPIPKESTLQPNEQISVDNKQSQLTCTFSITCSVLLKHIDKLGKEKQELIPDDGWIFMPQDVVFEEGETVYDILQRVCRQEKIHMESSFTILYNSAYIEGIGNIYEFDYGSLSGWMYRVNGEFPPYGCSAYPLKHGDVVEFLYTCNYGKDIGGKNIIS